MPSVFAEMLASAPEADEDLAAAMGALAPAYVHRADPEMLRSQIVRRCSVPEQCGAGLRCWPNGAQSTGSSITAPTLVLARRYDPFTAWPQADRIARCVSNADIVVFEHSSHFPWLDEPDAFFATLKEWLQRHHVPRRWVPEARCACSRSETRGRSGQTLDASRMQKGEVVLTIRGSLNPVAVKRRVNSAGVRSRPCSITIIVMSAR